MVIRPPVDAFGFMDFEAGNEIIDVGYRHAVDHFAEHGVPGT